MALNKVFASTAAALSAFTMTPVLAEEPQERQIRFEINADRSFLGHLTPVTYRCFTDGSGEIVSKGKTTKLTDCQGGDDPRLGFPQERDRDFAMGFCHRAARSIKQKDGLDAQDCGYVRDTFASVEKNPHLDIYLEAKDELGRYRYVIYNKATGLGGEDFAYESGTIIGIDQYLLENLTIEEKPQVLAANL